MSMNDAGIRHSTFSGRQLRWILLGTLKLAAFGVLAGLVAVGVASALNSGRHIWTSLAILAGLGVSVLAGTVLGFRRGRS